LIDEAQKTWFTFFWLKQRTVQYPVVTVVEGGKKNETKTAVDI